MKYNLAQAAVESTQKKKRGWFKKGLAGAGIVLGTVAAAKILGQVSVLGLGQTQPAPALDYDAALVGFARLQAEEGPEVNPVCRSQLMTHGHKTPGAIVLIHGLSNCPRQFLELGELLHAQGYNVLIPRIPYHGLLNRKTPLFKRLTAEKLKAFAENAVNIARGLGQEVTVAGLSAGGVMAAWVAQFRPDVAKVVIISPALGLKYLPSFAHNTTMKLLLRMPHYFIPRNPQNVLPHAYLQQSSRGTGEMLRLGSAVFEAAHNSKPAVQNITLILNPTDRAVDNKLSRQLLKRWQANGTESLRLYEFEASYKLAHDLISTQQPYQQTALIYPILLNLISS